MALIKMMYLWIQQPQLVIGKNIDFDKAILSDLGYEIDGFEINSTTFDLASPQEKQFMVLFERLNWRPRW